MKPHNLGRLYIQIDHLLLKWADEQSDKTFSLTVFFTLDFLQSQGPVSMKSLAEALDITPASVTTLSQKLERADWIERQPNPNDRRGALISITPAGSEILAGDYRSMQGFFDLHLSVDEQQHLASIFRRVIANSTQE